MKNIPDVHRTTRVRGAARDELRELQVAFVVGPKGCANSSLGVVLGFFHSWGAVPDDLLVGRSFFVGERGLASGQLHLFDVDGIEPHFFLASPRQIVVPTSPRMNSPTSFAGRLYTSTPSTSCSTSPTSSKPLSSAGPPGTRSATTSSSLEFGSSMAPIPQITFGTGSYPAQAAEH
eukprot:CAMPEP_0117025814 /NCGR_PEP_ID=MMETSP0472-20121206/19033_1 /TAXON_ID=693140 ORGANISM="Tiarina fusus, Strain LIS" /NCGR_SAMPLE_ID=MMETSP0472 /ASSEMBLY_ACC=CAM_ASM_000603 /LENGTH=175 /DNA_ID=CAMNT_0004732637 /DNA_START=320 /DNA_END=848 /DNA_ORIENTATION=-